MAIMNMEDKKPDIVKDRIVFLKETDSTNRVAKELAEEGAPHGTVVIAERQTKGRGRFGKTFYSPKGGLYMSIILRPGDGYRVRPSLTTAFAAVCVCNTIEKLTDKRPGIKWVNDVYIDGKKVSGILTEAVTDMETGLPKWIVLGIGVDLKGEEKDFPEEIRDIAGSVYGGKMPENGLSLFAGELINNILKKEKEDAKIMWEYRKRLMYVGEKVDVISGDNNYTATIKGIDDEGHLIVSDEKGKEHILIAGEISIRKKK